MAALPPGIEKLGPGRYRGRYYGPDGRRHSTPIYVKPAEAAYARNAALADIKSGRWLDPQRSGITVDQWFALWMPTRLTSGGGGKTVRPYVLEKDWARYRNHIKPWLGERTLPQITRFTLETWHADLAIAGRNPATISKAHALIKTALGRAADDDRITRNPATQTAPARPAKPKWQLVTRPQFATLLTEIPERYRCLVLLAAHTGLRWSEIVALTRADYNPLRGELLVDSGTVYHKGRLIDDRTKSGRHRTLPVVPHPDPTLNLRAALDAHVKAAQMAADARLFASPTGHTLRHPHFMERVFKPAAVRAGLGEYVKIDGRRRYRGIRFHDLRHSYISWLLNEGVDIHEVKDLAGHASITTTELYAHTDKDEVRAAVARALGG